MKGFCLVYLVEGMPVRASDFSMSSMKLKSMSRVNESPTDAQDRENDRSTLTDPRDDNEEEAMKSTHQHSEVERSKLSQPAWAWTPMQVSRGGGCGRRCTGACGWWGPAGLRWARSHISVARWRSWPRPNECTPGNGGSAEEGGEGDLNYASLMRKMG